MSKQKEILARAGKGAAFGRKMQGQAIMESMCMMVIGIPIFILMVMFFVNMWMAMTYQSKIQVAAESAAKAIQNHAWFIGMKRPDYDLSSAAAQSDATQVANKVLAAFGLGSASSCEVDASDTLVVSDKMQVQMVKVKLTVSGLGSFGDYFKIGTMTATGVATTDAAVAPYCVLKLSMFDQQSMKTRTTYVPCYSVGWSSGSTVQGQSVDGTTIFGSSNNASVIDGGSFAGDYKCAQWIAQVSALDCTEYTKVNDTSSNPNATDNITGISRY